MLIDAYTSDWLTSLDAMANDATAPESIYLLIDGAFVPAIHRQFTMALPSEERLYFMFDGLPGFESKSRDVSPFLLRCDPDNAALKEVLSQCSGWPMVSAIRTAGSIKDLAERLASWCIVQADEFNFNFRFPDTRRLPDVVAVLEKQQLTEMLGCATRWSYIDRRGQWVHLAMEGSAQPAALTPSLSKEQFAALIERSEADVMLARIKQIEKKLGVEVLSQQYEVVEQLLQLAGRQKLAQADAVEICRTCLLNEKSKDPTIIAEFFAQWHAEQLDA
jgi:hypothetical protein